LTGPTSLSCNIDQIPLYICILIYNANRVVLSLLGLLVVAATIHDAWRMFSDEPFEIKKDGPIICVLHCFSALTNGRKLLSMKVSKSPSNLSCVHGIRVLSTLWVVIGHTWIIGPSSFSVNPNMVKNVSRYTLNFLPLLFVWLCQYFSSLWFILHTSSIAAHKESLFTGKGLDCLLYRVDRNAMLAPTISTSDATLNQKALAFVEKE
jgi:hypothetical protein